MKYLSKLFIRFLLLVLLPAACTPPGQDDHRHPANETDVPGHQKGEKAEIIRFSAQQFDALEIRTGPLSTRNISEVVEANGELEVPPQNEATVTAFIGANIRSIRVIEGEDVRKGQVLAYLAHPTLTAMQSEYLENWQKMQYLEQEFQRQKKLYEAEVGAGKDFQRVRAEYEAARARVKGLAMQLQQIGLNPERIREGQMAQQVPVVSPIKGTITLVEVKTGQYVAPDKNLFEIVNIEHIHADLMVFEKDIYKVESGQQVRFTVATLPGQELFARIYSVGKQFEQDPKALHIHAEIENKAGKLIPGMYIQGQILTDSIKSPALPEAALIREGERHLAFLAEPDGPASGSGWTFHPVEVIPGIASDGWVSVSFMDSIPETASFALNNAYYLLAELRKGDTGHGH